ncbi:NTP transferase domain-containing protein [Burkholderia metallica]|uniref:Phosphocholine cytidylyltransferase family protein n=1 Tax=Burkholderia metallica TaxID=488729 RepID=A0ABT8P5M2_9BURK|nr:phosphocholine cytidylyltransferase family protein [Burkholderia metallica]AOJ34768.1 ADP-glucose pyrophosphorylase [Burkholderia metallica]MCA7999795.1 phosphocholine cytidylyltransferase family protein [Burkholderia metallica]MDN7930385.1 phosphocholine cytidylyltransferase family protein [Burkholderia metallica]VWC30918.1 ADP-glucose pyrophosphorylase [Burkholderia metallica]
MRAIILAAGLGLRLQQPPEAQFPKCLLRFDDVSLLERHLRVLDAAGVDEIVLGLGFQAEKVEQELKRLGRQAEIVINERYDLGSVLTVHTVADAMTRGGDVLLMDADVLYDENILHALVADADRAVDRLLIDRDFEAGDEPVKLCLKNGVPVELRKQLAVDLDYDTIGESVGFFRFTEGTARRLAAIVAGYVDSGRANMPHEEAVRDLLLEGGHAFDVADVTGSPWIEIDFPNDVARATQEILPLIQRTTAGAAR